MTDIIPITYLHDPTSSLDGKFYIGIEDDRCPFTVHGPKKATSKGVFTQKKHAADVLRMVRKKSNEGYSAAGIGDIPKPVIQAIEARVASSCGVPVEQVEVKFDQVLIHSTSGQPAARSKPRRRKGHQEFAFWL